MMVRMEMDYKMDFWKLFKKNFFQIFKFGFEIFEILPKFCCNTKFLQEIAFYHLFRVSICKSINFEFSIECQKQFALARFAFLRSTVCLKKKIAPLLNELEVKLKLIVSFSHAFSMLDTGYIYLFRVEFIVCISCDWSEWLSFFGLTTFTWNHYFFKVYVIKTKAVICRHHVWRETMWNKVSYLRRQYDGKNQLEPPTSRSEVQCTYSKEGAYLRIYSHSILTDFCSLASRIEKNVMWFITKRKLQSFN